MPSIDDEAPVEKGVESIPYSDRDRKAFVDLIELAEQVQNRIGTINRQILLLFASIVAIVLGFVAPVYFLYAQNSERTVLESPATFLFIAVLIVAYCGGLFLYASYSRQLKRERRAFREVMSIVHEVFESAKSDLSALEIAEIKIRLSRLDN